MNPTISALNDLTREVIAERFGKSASWQGGDVVISDKPADARLAGFYPDPRFVSTKFVGELSWLFEKLVPIFSQIDGYGAWKEELFGRLGNMANRVATKNKVEVVSELLLAVLHEAYSIAEELSQGTFQFLAVTAENMIYDDILEQAYKSGFISSYEAEISFRLKGLLP